jgi:N-acetylmuramoyl-L-alanine amidase
MYTRAKTRFVSHLILIIALIGLLAPVAVAFGQGGSGLITGVSRLNVRSGPGVGYPVVVILDAGANVGLIGRNADASWVQIQLAGAVQGWVNSRFVAANIPIANLPVTLSAGAASASVHAFFLNVRSGPGVAFAVVGTLGRGDGVNLVGRNFDASWAQIVLPNGTRGWVNSGYLVPSIPIVDLPITDGAGGGENPPPPPAWTGPTGVVTAFYLNVRYGPDITFGAFGRISRNQTVGLVGRNAAGTWVQIQIFGGGSGWVNANYLRPSAPIANLPVTG